MKSNLITRMITVCMCMVVVGFASDSKKVMVETKGIKSSPAHQKIQAEKKLWLESQQTEPVSFSSSYIQDKNSQKLEDYISQGLGRAENNWSVDWDSFPWDEENDRDTYIYVYLQDSYGDGWNGNEL